MKKRIIVDSCCDLTPEMREELQITSVPLSMRLGEREFVDDENFDAIGFLDEMKHWNDKVGSAAPSPMRYQNAIQASDSPSFVVTLSSQLSGSHESAATGNKLAQEAGHEGAYVIDSKSASAGETLIALKLHGLLAANAAREEIIHIIEKFVDNMRTLFVLENYDNLQKNGRLNRITGRLIHALNIKLIMGDDDHGTIKMYGQARGVNKMIEKLIKLIQDSGKNTKEGDIVISHCNNFDLAERLAGVIEERFHFKKIWIVPTGGLSTLYADNKGIILAF